MVRHKNGADRLPRAQEVSLEYQQFEPRLWGRGPTQFSDDMDHANKQKVILPSKLINFNYSITSYISNSPQSDDSCNYLFNF